MRYLYFFQNIFFYLTIILSSNGCFSSTYKEQLFNNNLSKIYLGISKTSNFQIVSENILLFHGFIIDSYDNNQTSNIITTKWKIRDPYDFEKEFGSVEAKTKILVEGKIISDSFNKNNGFNFECFLYYKNFVFKNGEYIEYYNSPKLNQLINQIAYAFRDNFDYYE